jgi:hypothetical protein
MQQVVEGLALAYVFDKVGAAMKHRMLGSLGVSEIGFGTMSFASPYGEAPDEDAAV